MAWSKRVIEALAILIALAVVARVVWGLLGPLVPVVGILVGLVFVFTVIFRGPHARK